MLRSAEPIPFGAYLQRERRGRRLQLGALLGSVGPGRLDSPLRIEITGERYDRPGGAADHRFSMLGVLSLDGDKPALGTAAGADPTTTARLQDMVDVPRRLPETAAGKAKVDAPIAVSEEHPSSRGPVEQPAAETAHGAPATPTRSADRSNRPRALAATACGRRAGTPPAPARRTVTARRSHSRIRPGRWTTARSRSTCWRTIGPLTDCRSWR